MISIIFAMSLIFGKLINMVENQNTQVDFLTVSEAARILNVSASTLRYWDKTGKLKSIRHPINGYRLFSKSQVNDLSHRIKVGLNGGSTNGSGSL